MGLFPRLPALDRLSGVQANLSLSDLDRMMDEVMSGRPTDSGVSVSEMSALSFIPLQTVVRVRGETLSMLSCHLYQRDEDGSRRATEHRLYSVVHDQPNDDMTSVDWFEVGSNHYDLWGNSINWLDVPRIGRNAGHIQGIYPLKPERIKEIKRVDGRLKYVYRRKKDDGSQEEVTYDQSQILHIPAMGDGIIGLSPIGMARQAIGLGQAIEEFAARFFGQGMNMGGVIRTSGAVTPAKRDEFIKYLKSQYEGLGKSHRWMVLDGVEEVKQLTMPLEDAQFLALRQYQLEEMCRMYRVPLILAQSHEKNTSWGTGIEQILIAYRIFTATPMTRKWEKRMNMRLLTERERAAGYYFEFDFNSLMRGDSKSRGEFYKLMREVGAMNPNEIREKENLNPYDGGDDFWTQGPSGQGANNADPEPSARLRASLRPVFADAAARIHKRETADITAAAERYAKKDDLAGFTGWLGDYWARHRDFCATALRPAYAALGDAGEADRQAAAHVVALECAVKAAATGGVDGVREAMEARGPAGLVGE